MKNLLNDVAAFHKACDVPVLETPTIPPIARQKLRLDLISEEYRETINALVNNNIEQIADGIADLIYVLVGTALEYGIPLDKVWDEVQRSNMMKVDINTGKVRKREDGKVLKPDGWKAPDIHKALFR